MYQDENTLQKIVDAFYAQNCAMVVGSYTMTNFAMETIAPGLIDHKEWTPDNGRNNALRINGLGAPRAFYTPVLRDIKVPNTSYGEDYALGLRISREYQIGRIYDSLYLCRRWDENSDASLDVVKMNGHNLYKDKIRTIELKARKKKTQTPKWETRLKSTEGDYIMKEYESSNMLQNINTKIKELFHEQASNWELAGVNFAGL